MAEHLGFSGSRTLAVEREPLVIRVLSHLPPPGKVNTGACIGVDQFIAQWYLDAMPSVPQTIWVPGDRSRVDMLWVQEVETRPNVTVRWLSGSYAERNLCLVAASDRLVAFPLRPRRVGHRSGTWLTVDMAIKHEKDLQVQVLG